MITIGKAQYMEPSTNKDTTCGKKVWTNNNMHAIIYTQ